MQTMYSIVIPAYNEEQSIKEVLERLKKIIAQEEKSFEIIVVNDGSTDGTAQVLEAIEGIILIKNPYNLGYGTSLLKGIKQAKGEYIVITDSDGTYPIDVIPQLCDYSKEYEMVVGSRSGENVPLLRKPAKWILTKLAEFLTARKIPDLNSGLRLFKKEIVIKYESLFPKRFSFTTTLTIICLLHNHPVKFLPIKYFKRKGKSSIRPVHDFLAFIQLIFRIIIYFNPLRFFIIPGLLSIVAGVVIGLLQAYMSIIVMKSTPQVGDIPVLLIVTGLQIVFFGIIADLIVKSRK